METKKLIEAVKIFADDTDNPETLEILYHVRAKLEKLDKWEKHYFEQIVKEIDFTPRKDKTTESELLPAS